MAVAVAGGAAGIFGGCDDLVLGESPRDVLELGRQGVVPAIEEVYKKAHDWLQANIEVVRPGIITSDIAKQWPTAEALGYPDELAAAGLCVGHAARLWTKRLDDDVHAATAVVTFAIGPRSLLLQQPRDLREANIEAIPDPKARAARRSVIEHGVDAPEFAAAFDEMLRLLDEVDAALLPGGWLSGSGFGLADAAVLPYVLRLDHLAMTPLLASTLRPGLSDWYERVRARASFETAVARWAPEFAVEVLRSNGEVVWPRVAALARK